MTQTAVATLILLGLFIGLLLLRFPILYAIGLSTLATFCYLDISLGMVISNMVKGVNSFSLMSIPFFVLAGEIMSAGGISDRLMLLANALVGACATLTWFFLQQRVEAAVTVPALLGPALFVLGLGGGLAGLLTGRLDRLSYGRAASLVGAGTAVCALLARGTSLPALLCSGLAAGLLGDALNLVSDKRLNDCFPSAQRATLVSVSSMAFSLFMIPLSPLFGWFFT